MQITNNRFLRVRETIAGFIAPSLVEQRDTARREAETDALTGLANARALNRALPKAEADEAAAILVFDGNSFGKVNKVCGHKQGDVLIAMAALAVKRAATRHGYGVRAFRKGGDEFVVLCAWQVADAIRAEAERQFGTLRLGGVCVSLTGSVGATFEEADAELQKLKRTRKERTR